MAEITPEVVRHVAVLSRLELNNDEMGCFVSDLNRILHYVEKLDSLDTSGVQPTAHAFHQENVFREDEVRPSLTNAEALSNAPDSEDACFKVPQVIQDTGGA
jgi:aspartyl-tRNA(Asn)/glutamyl-tRNA(Gln) amidotransferase subunit C